MENNILLYLLLVNSATLIIFLSTYFSRPTSLAIIPTMSPDAFYPVAVAIVTYCVLNRCQPPSPTAPIMAPNSASDTDSVPKANATATSSSPKPPLDNLGTICPSLLVAPHAAAKAIVWLLNDSSPKNNDFNMYRVTFDIVNRMAVNLKNQLRDLMSVNAPALCSANSSAPNPNSGDQPGRSSIWGGMLLGPYAAAGTIGDLASPDTMGVFWRVNIPTAKGTALARHYKLVLGQAMDLEKRLSDLMDGHASVSDSSVPAAAHPKSD